MLNARTGPHEISWNFSNYTTKSSLNFLINSIVSKKLPLLSDLIFSCPPRKDTPTRTNEAVANKSDLNKMSCLIFLGVGKLGQDILMFIEVLFLRLCFLA